VIVAAAVVLLLLGALPLGWRQGAGKRRRRVVAPAAAPAAPRPPRDPGRASGALAALLTRRRGRKVPGGEAPSSGTAEPPRLRVHRAPPPPSAPKP
jgi:hypothetical protein